MIFKKSPLSMAVVYTATSLLIEALVMVAGRLKVPDDNAILAPIVLTIPPALAVWICGYRRLGQWILAAVLTAALTLGVTMLLVNLTGLRTGLLEPILVRGIAGFLAAGFTNRIAPGRSPMLESALTR